MRDLWRVYTHKTKQNHFGNVERDVEGHSGKELVSRIQLPKIVHTVLKNTRAACNTNHHHYNLIDESLVSVICGMIPPMG